MDENEKKFFESLANPDNEDLGSRDFQVELAKTSAPVAVPKTIRKAVKEKFGSETEGQLTIDVYQTPDEIIVESAIAGVKPEDLDVSVTSDSVTIRGERRRENEIKESNYLYQECYWGKFSRSIILPQEVDADSAWVNMKGGILTVHLPKRDKKQEKKLRVKTD